MNKRITSVVLSFVLLLVLLVTAVPVLAEGSVPITVTADKTSANPGDTINYTVSIGAVTNMGGLEFYLDIPTGLTIVESSIVIPSGLGTVIDSDGEIVSPKSGNNYYWAYSAQSTGYTGTERLVILTFSCTVDDGVSGNKSVSVKNVLLMDNTYEMNDIPFAVTPATVNVTIPHVHVYDKETLDYLVSPATCTSPAVYHKSCACGAEGTETFTSGSALGHDYTQQLEDAAHLKTAASKCTEHNIYWYDCSRCDSNAKNDPEASDKYFTSATTGSHSFTEEIADNAHYVAGTGTNCLSVKQYYYDCAYCNEIGTNTWDSTEYGPHNFSAEWTQGTDTHWHACSLCGEKDSEADHDAAQTASAEYLKTPADCTSPAVYYEHCSGCDKKLSGTFTSGSALGHDYTKKVENNTYLKTAASNCTEYNVYWYACSRCDANAKDDAAATDKYYTSTTAGSHSFTEQIADNAHYVAGTGTNCQSVKQYYYDCAYCDQIGTTTWDSTTYGEHNYAATWSSDADGHWHECSLCHGKKDEAAHTPGAAATETTPQKCTECDYIITAALGHTHHMTPVAANPATCTTDGNTAYYVCSGCSKLFADATGNVEITDPTSVVITRLGHNWAPAKCTTPKTCSRCNATEGSPLGHRYEEKWSKNSSKHWHECTVCGDKADKADHIPGPAATETRAQTCTACGYVIAPMLAHTHRLTKVDASPASCTEDGNIEYYKCAGCGMLFEDATGSVQIADSDSVIIKALGHDYEWVIDKEATETEDGSKHEECTACHDKKAPVEIPATGTTTDPTPEKPDSPQTGDNSMMGLWFALLLVFGACVTGTIMYLKKKKHSAK